MALETHGLTDSDFRLLTKAPILIFNMVAAADENIDRREIASFKELIEAFAASDSPVIRDVMRALSAELESADHLLMLPTPEAEAELAEVGRVSSALPEGGKEFRMCLMELGTAIAESSGKQLTRTYTVGGVAGGWQPSSGVSAHERAALEAVAAALGIDP
ncbi:MAG: hypothetical protein ABI577_08930 [bacterium]